MPPKPYAGPKALGLSRYAVFDTSEQSNVPSASTTAAACVPGKGMTACVGKAMEVRPFTGVATVAEHLDARFASAEAKAKASIKESDGAPIETPDSVTQRLLDPFIGELTKEDTINSGATDKFWSELTTQQILSKGTNSNQDPGLDGFKEDAVPADQAFTKVIVCKHDEGLRSVAQSEAKSAQLDMLQEKMSRLTLEKGNFRTEVERLESLLKHERTTSASKDQALENIRLERDALAAEKDQIIAESAKLRQSVKFLREDMTRVEAEVVSRCTAQFKAKSEELALEQSKLASYSDIISMLKDESGDRKNELDKLKNEHALLCQKNTRLTDEHAQAFAERQEIMKTATSAKLELIRLSQENDQLKEANTEVVKLRTEVIERTKKETVLLQQITALNNEFGDFQKNRDVLKEEMRVVHEKATKMEAELCRLKSEHHSCRAQSHGCQASHVTNEEKVMLVNKIEALEEKRNDLDAQLKEWMQLAKQSYREYKQLLHMPGLADCYRKEAEEKGNEVESLKKDLLATQAKQKAKPMPNGMLVDGDASYWKQKYDDLLSSID